MSYCKFLVSETIQTICHEFCQNPDMLAINKTSSGKLACIGERCGMAVKDVPDNDSILDTKIP
jgi:hypothetical protein